MAKVKNLTIKQQASSDGLIATWEFDQPKHVSTTTSSGDIRKGDWVKVKSGSKWYNGVSIASFVFNEEWQVIEVRGDRAVIDKNRSGSNSICSPINVNNLTGGSGGATTTTTTTNTLDHYVYQWFYTTGDKKADGSTIFYSDGEKTTTDTYATYNPPDSAITVHCHVTPIAKTYKVNNKDTSYWTGEFSNYVYAIAANRPDEPSVPTVTIDGLKLTATIDNIDSPYADSIEFEVYDGTTYFTYGSATVSACQATFITAVSAGGSYRVRARAVNNYGSHSSWSDFCTAVSTIPSAPAGITRTRGQSSTSIYLEWSPVTTATSYEVEYATSLDYFDGSNETKTQSNIGENHFLFTGLDSGYTYFFRVRATNDKGSSDWCDIQGCIIGKMPNAPTTWSSTTTVIVGEPLQLYFVHNSADNSVMTTYEVDISTDGGETWAKHVGKNDSSDDEAATTYSFEVDTSSYSEGIEILWRVRTTGATMEYGAYSVVREVDVYAQPTLALTVTDANGAAFETLAGFPFSVKGVAAPNTQTPVGYYLSVAPTTSYTATTATGEERVISGGELIYQQYFAAETGKAFSLDMTPALIDLEAGIEYTLTLMVSMNSGLTATASKIFNVSWADAAYDIDAQISVDEASYVAYIIPFIAALDDKTADVSGVVAVYRREYDGTFQLIQDGIEPNMQVAVTDPHPALDYARYRIVFTDSSTGTISYYDVPAYPTQSMYSIIQWNEDWSEFSADSSASLREQPWAGSMIKLLYDPETAYNTSVEKNLVSYQGRSYPVVYFGSAIDTQVTWSFNIERSDTDTIYQLRRLQRYLGSVYVRDPSGFGCWASVDVNFSRSYENTSVPVSISIKRVDGDA